MDSKDLKKIITTEDQLRHAFLQLGLTLESKGPMNINRRDLVDPPKFEIMIDESRRIEYNEVTLIAYAVCKRCNHVLDIEYDDWGIVRICPRCGSEPSRSYVEGYKHYPHGCTYADCALLNTDHYHREASRDSRTEDVAGGCSQPEGS